MIASGEIGVSGLDVRSVPANKLVFVSFCNMQKMVDHFVKMALRGRQKIAPVCVERLGIASGPLGANGAIALRSVDLVDVPEVEYSNRAKRSQL